MAEKPTSEEMRRRGRLGGLRTKERYGVNFYSGIGKIGGETTRNNQGVLFYSELGRIGGKKVGKSTS